MAHDPLDPALRAQLIALGDAPVDLIVRTRDKPDARVDACAALGVTIRYRYNLLPGLAISAPASAALRLAGEPWVDRIEPDRAVRAL